MNGHPERIGGNLFGLSLIGFAIAAYFWEDRLALLLIVPGAFFFFTSVGAFLYVPRGTRPAQALHEFLVYLIPAFVLFGLGTFIVGRTTTSVVLWAIAALIAVIWLPIFIQSKRPEGATEDGSGRGRATQARTRSLR